MASLTRALVPLACRYSVRSSRSSPASFSKAIRSPVHSRTFSVSAAVQAKKYTREHEWVELSDDGKTGVIGISEYAANALGDVVYVELPEVPMEVVAGDSIGAVESVKSASDINTPISCKITSVNTLLEEKPATINKGPEDDSSAGGWVAKIEVGEAGQQDLLDLMDHKTYKEFVEEYGDE